jgi:uncharacterized protein YbjT (DUF2867 family)
MRILITGASGLVGEALAHALTARGHQVIAAVRDPQRMAAPAPMLLALGRCPQR